jgi:hypothetical protein
MLIAPRWRQSPTAEMSRPSTENPPGPELTVRGRSGNLDVIQTREATLSSVLGIGRRQIDRDQVSLSHGLCWIALRHEPLHQRLKDHGHESITDYRFPTTINFVSIPASTRYLTQPTSLRAPWCKHYPHSTFASWAATDVSIDNEACNFEWPRS